ncbi:Uncharacterised protein [Vibrio cholerae]|nr:Uncharacterised protein [Vibrio cholerae]CSI63610.1 Uncharacterised protein [Vibrio cholerae]
MPEASAASKSARFETLLEPGRFTSPEMSSIGCRVKLSIGCCVSLRR